jgi:hypothetical protein
MAMLCTKYVVASQHFASNPLVRTCKVKDPSFLPAALEQGRALLVRGQSVAVVQDDQLLWIDMKAITAGQTAKTTHC